MTEREQIIFLPPDRANVEVAKQVMQWQPDSISPHYWRDTTGKLHPIAAFRPASDWNDVHLMEDKLCKRGLGIAYVKELYELIPPTCEEQTFWSERWLLLQAGCLARCHAALLVLQTAQEATKP